VLVDGGRHPTAVSYSIQDGVTDWRILHLDVTIGDEL
jgi:hypothetical protein